MVFFQAKGMKKNRLTIISLNKNNKTDSAAVIKNNINYRKFNRNEKDTFDIADGAAIAISSK